MAATNGTLHSISVDGTKIDRLTTTSFNGTRDTREFTNKDSGGDREYAASFKNATFGFAGFADSTATYGVEELYDAWDAGDTVSVVYSTGTTGATTYSATALITSFSFTADAEENVEFQGEVLVTGSITKGTVA